MSDVEDSDVSNSVSKESRSLSKKNAKEHVEQLQRLQEKDPEFYQYLKDHDKELLEFDDEDIDENTGTDLEDDDDSHSAPEKLQKAPEKVITTAMVDSWCKDIKEYGKLGAVRSLLRAFRTASHYGDDRGNDSKSKFSIISSSVFNRIMVFVLNEMDGILRGVLKAPNSGGKKEMIMDLMTTKVWKKNGCLMKLYLGNALHILTQMTDEQMISFTLKRVKASAVFLAAFPTLLRKYIKVALHSWGNGRGALPVVSFLFLRDLCVRLGSDCLDTCLKGVYKAYIMNCKLAKNVSRSKLQHINFLGNCVSELYGVDIPSAYQHAFVFIRQLAVILRGALTERGSKVVKDNKKEKGKQGSSKSTNQEKVYQKVYDWQFISCLELWTSVICAYSSEADFRPLAYPLTQIISGVASLVPTARYFPLRLRCVRMLNRLAGATGTFIPVSPYLLDMLEMKELKRPPTGGVGKAVNLLGVKQVDKTTLKTRAFQEACIYSVVEELAEHLAQWSFSVAFFELSFVPLVQLRSFCKSTNIDRFRREIKALIQQVEANIEFTNSKRMVIDFSPNDPAIESFLKVEKESGSSPLSQFASSLRLRAQQRSDSMVESSVFVGEEGSVFGSKLSKVDDKEDDEESEGEGDEEEGAAVFSSSWLPEKKPQVKEKPKTSKKHHDKEEDVAIDEDLVKDLVLSSDEEEEDEDDGREGGGDDDDDDEPNDIAYSEDGEGLASTTLKHSNKKVESKRKKPASRTSKTRRGSRGKRTKKTRVV